MRMKTVTVPTVLEQKLFGTPIRESYYQTRFAKQSDAPELIDLYHLARTALSSGPCGRCERMNWAAQEFHKTHPEVSVMGAYKDLYGLLA